MTLEDETGQANVVFLKTCSTLPERDHAGKA